MSNIVAETNFYSQVQKTVLESIARFDIHYNCIGMTDFAWISTETQLSQSHRDYKAKPFLMSLPKQRFKREVTQILCQRPTLMKPHKAAIF